ncbi:hypothetical protein BJ508DRAFT_418266 [Ascobolus immersus RN42]|uniref:Uncharacterized protein n=1 Tax=Ascobolus immersus RN42 TaxID=1160509 RepID=A0A3N4HMV5_ASCIM|nr:hypothetical protein BJ508DRAFT_418266 [Ascobolus immersus RN42]
MVLERQSREIRSPLNGFPVVFNFDLMLDGLTSTFWLTTMQSRRPEWLTTRDLFDAGYGLNSSGDGRLYHETLDQTNLHYNLAKYPLYEDSKYPSDRIDLLIEVFRQLFAVYDEWRQVRKGVDSRIRSLAKEKKHREILEVIKEYYTNEEMHHMEHGGKFMFLLRLVTFIHKARIPSVDERILRHLSGDY